MSQMQPASGRQQFIRFAVVGMLSNAVLFGLYLVLTRAGLTPAVSMSLAYAVGVLHTFAWNRRWTFSYAGGSAVPFARYMAAYGVGYLVNLLLLRIFVDQLGLAHQAVQGAAILLVAALVFVLQKHWVFPAAQQQPGR